MSSKITIERNGDLPSPEVGATIYKVVASFCARLEDIAYVNVAEHGVSKDRWLDFKVVFRVFSGEFTKFIRVTPNCRYAIMDSADADFEAVARTRGSFRGDPTRDLMSMATFLGLILGDIFDMIR